MHPDTSDLQMKSSISRGFGVWIALDYASLSSSTGALHVRHVQMSGSPRGQVGSHLEAQKAMPESVPLLGRKKSRL